MDSAVAEDLAIADAVDLGIEAGEYTMMAVSVLFLPVVVVSRRI